MPLDLDPTATDRSGRGSHLGLDFRSSAASLRTGERLPTMFCGFPVTTEVWTGCSRSWRTRGHGQRGWARPGVRQRSGWSGLGRKWPLVVVQSGDSLHGKVEKRIKEVR
jgi:hypothetical protein